MKALNTKSRLFAGLLLMAAAALPAAASASPIDLRGDLCENRRPFNLNDVIARGDFVDVVRNLWGKGGVTVSLEEIEAMRDASKAGDRQTVVVDGILMELPAHVIEGMIRNGTFIPVYPGTTIPIDRDDWGHELPCWGNPDCP
ncbi:MAG: hypothetical protein AAFN78_14745 [Pseudomonadota bacterium]